MLSAALFYLLAVICSARTHALPLYPDANLGPQAEFIQKLVAEVEDGESPAQEEQREMSSLYPLLTPHNGAGDEWNKGAKESAQQDTFTNMVDSLKEVVLKLAAANKLRSQGFLRSEQSLPKHNKRACFWKYCVTN